MSRSEEELTRIVDIIYQAIHGPISEERFLQMKKNGEQKDGQEERYYINGERLSDFYRTQYPTLMEFITKMVSPRQDAEDIASNVFYKVIVTYPRYHHVRKPNSLLKSMARNEIASYYRRHGKVNPVKDDDSLPPECLLPEYYPLEKFKLHLVDCWASRLSPAERKIVVLYYYQGRSYDQLADIEQSTKTAIRARIFRIMRSLRKMVE